MLVILYTFGIQFAATFAALYAFGTLVGWTQPEKDAGNLIALAQRLGLIQVAARTSQPPVVVESTSVEA